MAETHPGTALRSNHALWLGPVLAVPGLLTYFGFFSRWPAFRDTPWVNLAILAAAVGLSVVGLRRAWPRGGWRRLAAAAGLLFSGAFASALVAYCYVLSYQVPDADLAVAEGGHIPAAVLAAHDGSQVDLGAAAQERLVLVFYRGFW